MSLRLSLAQPCHLESEPQFEQPLDASGAQTSCTRSSGQDPQRQDCPDARSLGESCLVLLARQFYGCFCSFHFQCSRLAVQAISGPNTKVKPRRVVEPSTWQALPAMCLV